MTRLLEVVLAAEQPILDLDRPLTLLRWADMLGEGHKLDYKLFLISCGISYFGIWFTWRRRRVSFQLISLVMSILLLVESELILWSKLSSLRTWEKPLDIFSNKKRTVYQNLLYDMQVV